MAKRLIDSADLIAKYSEQCALRRAERGERKGGQAPQREDV